MNFEYFFPIEESATGMKMCHRKLETITESSTALDLANKNSIPPQLLPKEVVEESQEIIPSEVSQEPRSNSSSSQQILNKIPSNPTLWNAFCITTTLHLFTDSTLKSAKKYVSQLTLKPLNATRWSSRVSALKALRSQLCEIYDALFRIIEDVNRDAETKMKARGLARNIKNHNFICGVQMLSETIQKVKDYRQSGYDCC
ncbi:hypothetical protein ILUMI_11728 [Ignelater luminosus]|uniref:Uncharacterized protein n=1 Tax=Ignelater luminosus TaxID=2038154 RepID=A0A8K0CXV5_IGNLU|nr:hypothetical protein ILUMI_11728 [Ignelater luminosus]